MSDVTVKLLIIYLILILFLLTLQTCCCFEFHDINIYVVLLSLEEKIVRGMVKIGIQSLMRNNLPQDVP